LIERTNRALASGYDGLRFGGDYFWLEKLDFKNLINYEKKLDIVSGNYNMIVLCTNFSDGCDITGIIDIVFNHQFVLVKKDGKWERMENSGRKRAEEAETKLKDTLDNLEKLVEKRTIQLEKANDSVIESERRLNEAQKMAHIGSWEWDIVNDKATWSDEFYRIFGLIPQEFSLNYDKILNYIHPDDRDHIEIAIKKAFRGKTFDIIHRIITADGKERIVHAQSEVIFDEKKNPIRVRGTVQDVTERKMVEDAMEKIDRIRIKEVHHRIKNNLQVISSLLSLQAEKFSDPKMLEAFRESQNRVASIALIHEELYKGNEIETLNFADYLRKLTAELLSLYRVRNDSLSLKLNLEQVYLNMDTAVPLGIIVSELVSNALKHAFPAEMEGEIQVNICKTGPFAAKHDVSQLSSFYLEKDFFQYKLTVADDGIGIPEAIDLENADSLGLQLVNTLVEQIDGCIELKRNNGTEFTIWFRNVAE
jgi:PAS domain S-box-containing protein